MVKYIKNVKNALFEVYQNRRYLFLTITFSFIIFSFNALINNYKILTTNFSFKLFFSLMAGSIKAMSSTSFTFLILISLLAGIVLSMSTFLLRRQIKGAVASSSSTILVSLIAPACPSCAIGLLSVLGFGSFLGFLPFRGLELGVFAIVLLIISVIYLSGKIVTKTCKIKK